MQKLQFRVLYRQFLFRMVDLEVLSAHALGDASKLYGQFASLLIAASILFVIPALRGIGRLQGDPRFIFCWSAEHFLIATTMFTVGLFAVLSWDSTFPDRRDVLVLAPLPVRAKTLFAAKVAAVASGLGLTVLLLNSAAGLIWPILFVRASTPQAAPVLTYLPAMPPVKPADMQAVLDRDLQPARMAGIGPLAPEIGTGVTIGILKNGERSVFSFGHARPDSLFEIASITKTFTATLLARMLVEGQVRLDEPVRELLPLGTVAKVPGDEITLLDLATHHSGLPAMPPNLQPTDVLNPLADYHLSDLYAYLGRRSLLKRRDVEFAYSNLGFALLGQALANRAGMPYPDLLKTLVTEPLGLHDTVIALSPDQANRLLQGHNTRRQQVPVWEMDAIAPAGALRSTAADMLTYLDAHLHPEKFAAANPALAAALRETHVLHANVTRHLGVGLSWMISPESGLYEHTGATAGTTSDAFFDTERGYAGIVLVNSGFSADEFTVMLGEHVRQRLNGQPATQFARVMVPAGGGVGGWLRSTAAYWITMLAAGAFIFCCVLGVQGLAAQLLPRRIFLRVSSMLQLAAFCILVCAYFLQPILATTSAIVDAENNPPLSWSPSYWFLGLFQLLNGSPALAPLAHRAWVGLAIAVSVTAVAYALSYWRSLRQIVEEPDIVPAARWSAWTAGWLPRFGNLFDTSVGQFAARTLLRSRLHRMILAFYLGIGFALMVFFLKSPPSPQILASSGAGDPWRQVNIPMLVSSVVMLTFWILGMRVVFGMPLDLRANWIFRVAPVRGGPDCLRARRRTMLALGVAPFWTVSAVVLLWLWPFPQAVGHLLVLGLLGIAIAEICLHGAQRIPFACSYLPGKSNVHITFWFCVVGLAGVVIEACQWERQALEDPFLSAVMIAGLAIAAVAARWWTSSAAKEYETAVQFEDAPVPAVQVLGLNG